MGDPCADLGKFPRIAEEIHNFLQLQLLFVCTGNILKGDLFTVGNTQHSTGFAEVAHMVAACAIGSDHQNKPNDQQDNANQKQGPYQVKGFETVLGNKIIGFQSAVFQLLFQQPGHLLTEQVCIVQIAKQFGFPIIGVMQIQRDQLAVYRKAVYLLIVKQLLDLGICQVIGTVSKQPGDPGKQKKQNDRIDDNG